MFLIIGYVIILAASVGTYALHGSLAALWVPAEYVAIFGLMIGGFVAGNGMPCDQGHGCRTAHRVQGFVLQQGVLRGRAGMLYEILRRCARKA
jgi:chemotaxis protein MotA